MDALLVIVAALVAAATSGWLAFLIGDRAAGRSWLHGLAVAAGLFLGVASAALGLLMDLQWLWVGGLAFVGGWLTGLKYGYAKNPGARTLRREVTRGR